MDEPQTDFCPLCNKPFTVVSSFKRHVAYCQRAQTKPRKRQLACRACSNAKAKCSFGSPCTRCASRSVVCVYDNNVKKTRITASSTDDALQTSAPEGIVASTGQANDVVLDDASLSQIIIDSDVGQKFFDTSITWDTTVDSILQESAPAVTEQPTFDFGPSFWNILGQRITTDHCMATFEEMNHFQSFYQYHPGSPLNETLISSRGQLGTLGPRGILSNVSQVNVTLVLQSLRTFPQKMLSRDDPPFFIHPYKHLDALPEPLAVCSRICHMFATRSPEILPFIWRCIRTEELRFLEEPMSKDDLLAASQAQVVYIMMMVIEGGMRRLEWVQEMLMLSGSVCQRLFMVSTEEMNRRYAPTEDTTWEEWLYLESRKRKLIVWFIMSLIFSTNTGITCNNAAEIRMLGLPAPRLVWESSDPLAWKRHLELQSSSKLQTLGDLIDANNGHPALAKELDIWNAKSDQLGSLLNVAISILK